MDRRKFMTNSNLVATNGNTLRVTPAGDLPIPLHDSITVELDTGRVVEMVVGELSMLYELGEIPDDLTPIAARELLAPPKDEPPAAREKRYFERLKLARWVAGRVLTQPRVVEKPKGNAEIAITGLYHDEIWQIYGLANSPASALDNFRRQQARHVATLPGQQDVGPQAEPADAAAAAVS